MGVTIFKTVEPCIDEAELIIKQLREHLNSLHHQRLRNVFNALASGDAEVGLLAYYLWRKSKRSISP